MTNTNVRAVLHSLLWHYATTEPLNLVEFDPEWPSPCVVGQPDDNGMVHWQPVEMEPPDALSTLEATLREYGQVLHPDVASFYTSFLAGRVESEHSGEPVILYTRWNDNEFGVDNLVCGVHEAIEYGLPVTFPIAGTGSDVLFTLDNATGAIMLQEVGYPPSRVVAPSLVAFLSQL